MSVDTDAYRSATGRLPAGVAVLAVRQRGLDIASTVSSVVSLSLDPPLMLVSLHSASRVRETLDDVDVWALSVLGHDAAPVADWLASPGRPAVDQLVRVPHRTGEVSGAAVLEGAAAWFECRTREVIAGGDHDIVVGDVLALGEGAPDAGALVHFRGRLRPIT